MLSQQRSRKTGGVPSEAARGRSVVKASGDTISSNVQHKQTVRSTSKNKIPKSLRYDLENALVGLCDVWFEEIKPHLVQNNIKVHIHSGGTGPASGDHQLLPPGAPGCSHLDPGAAPDPCQRAPASCAAYCSTQPTASKARCRRPPAARRPACPPPVPSPAKLRASLLNPHQNCESKHPSARPPRQPLRPPPNWRTPRLCRTISTLAPATAPPRRVRTAAPHMTRRYTHRHSRQPKKADKSTQTPVLRRPKIVPLEEQARLPIRPEFIKQELLKESLKQEKYKPEQNRETSRAKVTPSCLRCPATTALCSTHRSGKQSSPLFKEDLINIIAEKHDTRLRLLYKSPTRVDNTSSLNLVQPAPPAASTKRRAHWR